MSAPDKPDPVKAWLFAEKLLDEEADRIAALSDADFEREMDVLPDPPHVPSAEELVARADRRARERAMPGAGAKAAVPVPTRRISWLAWPAAAAIGAAIVALVVERREIVAWFRHEPAPIGPDLVEPEKRVTAQRRATELRDAAFAACGEALWALCNGKLDEARQLDPAGESEARVVAARKAAFEGTHPDGGEKPPRR